MKLRRLRSPWFATSLGLAAVLVAGSAFAQSPADLARAQALFDEGTRLLDAKNYADACSKLEESQHLAVGLGVTLYLADCYENIGRTASAWQAFRAAEGLAHERSDAREAIAHDRAAKLEPRLSRLVIAPRSDDAAAIEIAIDGRFLEKSAWSQPLPVDPGAHVIQASAPGRDAWEQRLDVPATPGDVRVDIPRLVEPPSAAPPRVPQPSLPPPSKDGRTQRLVALGVGGVGLIGLGLGTYFGLHASSKQSDASAHCNGMDQCDGPGLQLRQDALGAATISTIAFIVGGAAAAGGAILYFTAPKPDAGFAITPVVTGKAASLTLGATF